MRVVLQRVTSAKLCVEHQMSGEIGHGLVVLLGIGREDNAQLAVVMAEKVANLRIFGDEAAKMNLSLIEVAGSAMVVSQFTLLADTQRGRRPFFGLAAAPIIAEPIYQAFVEAMRQWAPVIEGKFGANMQIQLCNDGPVTLVLEL